MPAVQTKDARYVAELEREDVRCLVVDLGSLAGVKGERHEDRARERDAQRASDLDSRPGLRFWRSVIEEHAAQIELLSGVGGKGVAKGDPNLMFGSRTNCFGCHVKEATTAHGGMTSLWPLPSGAR